MQHHQQTVDPRPLPVPAGVPAPPDPAAAAHQGIPAGTQPRPARRRCCCCVTQRAAGARRARAGEGVPVLWGPGDGRLKRHHGPTVYCNGPVPLIDGPASQYAQHPSARGSAQVSQQHSASRSPSCLATLLPLCVMMRNSWFCNTHLCMSCTLDIHGCSLYIMRNITLCSITAEHCGRHLPGLHLPPEHQPPALLPACRHARVAATLLPPALPPPPPPAHPGATGGSSGWPPRLGAAGPRRPLPSAAAAGPAAGGRAGAGVNGRRGRRHGTRVSRLAQAEPTSWHRPGLGQSRRCRGARTHARTSSCPSSVQKVEASPRTWCSVQPGGGASQKAVKSASQ